MKKSFDRKDRLERFVRDNRSGFDTEEPDARLWKKIEAGLAPSALPDASRQPGTNRWKRQITYDWRVAATVIVLLFAGILVYVNGQYGLTRDPQMALQVPAYAKEVNQYTQIINEKRNQLKKLATHKPELYSDFASELDRLEKAYTGLRSELPRSPDPETLLHAMVRNLQWQVDLLNQQIIIIESIEKGNENEESDSDRITI